MKNLAQTDLMNMQWDQMLPLIIEVNQNLL